MGYFPQEPWAGVARDPRGCDMARKATWQSHASPRGARVAPCGSVRGLAGEGPTGSWALVR